jgi:hypothetical protein
MSPSTLEQHLQAAVLTTHHAAKSMNDIPQEGSAMNPHVSIYQTGCQFQAQHFPSRSVPDWLIALFSPDDPNKTELE